ncbi:MAG: HD domain-containing protein [Candidatus Adlerbacteria bacterium]|nr:HD domain-containing protein [Candidatus Adlerbacteria bacterium]
MNVVQKASAIAEAAHRDQKRKTDGSPYIAHPRAVAEILTKYGFKEEVVAAALVHDVLEDTDFSPAELHKELNGEVFNLVEAVTEDKSLPWEERKKKYIEAVRVAGADAKAIAAADHIHNLQSILSAYEKQGAEVWKHFNRGKDEKIWFEEEMLKMLTESWQHPLLEEYEKLLARMKTLD